MFSEAAFSANTYSAANILNISGWYLINSYENVDWDTVNTTQTSTWSSDVTSSDGNWAVIDTN